MGAQEQLLDAEQQQLRQNIRKLYVYRVLLGLMFPVATIVLFWQKHGMNLTQVMVLQSLFAIAMVCLEMPSGYLADVIGRRKTLILAGYSNSVAIIVYSVGDNFFHFLIAELFFAFGFAMISGADAALMYDTLQAIGEEEQYKELYGKYFFYNLFAVGGANIIGGLIATISFRLTFYATLPCFLLAVVTAMSFREPPRKTLQVQQGYTKELLNILRYCFFQNLRLRWLIIYSGFIIGANNAALWFYQPYFKLCGLSVAYFGVAFASYQIVAAISSKYASNIEQRFGAKLSLWALVFLVGIGYFLMGSVVFLLSFTFAFFHQFTRGFSRIVTSDYINQLTESDIRATVLSAQNLIMRIFYALLLPVAGKIADETGIVPALNILGVTTILVGIVMLVVMHKKKVF